MFLPNTRKVCRRYWVIYPSEQLQVSVVKGLSKNGMDSPSIFYVLSQQTRQVEPNRVRGFAVCELDNDQFFGSLCN
jgi:hypothetical protein